MAVSVSNIYYSLSAMAQEHGLALRGYVHDTALKFFPHPTLIFLVGSVGDGFFHFFKKSPEYQEYLQANPDIKPSLNPLNEWSRRILAIMQEQYANLGGLAVSPSDGPPYFPFQQAAIAAGRGRLTPSPIGLLIDNEYGLWHAYRGALVLHDIDNVDISYSPPRDQSCPTSPCENCDDKPCLNACPVKAFKGIDDISPSNIFAQYDKARCHKYLRDDKDKTCFQTACHARAACPIAPNLRYRPDVAQFFMQAFYN